MSQGDMKFNPYGPDPYDAEQPNQVQHGTAPAASTPVTPVQAVDITPLLVRLHTAHSRMSVNNAHKSVIADAAMTIMWLVRQNQELRAALPVAQ